MAANSNYEYEGYKSPTIEIANGRIFIDGEETIDTNLIGYALIDFAQNQEEEGKKIVFKEQDVFVEPLFSAV